MLALLRTQGCGATRAEEARKFTRHSWGGGRRASARGQFLRITKPSRGAACRSGHRPRPRAVPRRRRRRRRGGAAVGPRDPRWDETQRHIRGGWSPRQPAAGPGTTRAQWYAREPSHAFDDRAARELVRAVFGHDLAARARAPFADSRRPRCARAAPTASALADTREFPEFLPRRAAAPRAARPRARWKCGGQRCGSTINRRAPWRARAARAPRASPPAVAGRTCTPCRRARRGAPAPSRASAAMRARRRRRQLKASTPPPGACV